MSSALWKGTALEQVSAEIWGDPKLRATFYMGQVETTVADLFGVGSDDDHVPRKVQEFAIKMLEGLLTGADMEAVGIECARIAQELRKEAN